MSAVPQDPKHPDWGQRKFRTDIQALRGYAVLIVLLYHAKLGGLSAGFLGVDVFFVLSGFLITRLIRDGLDRGNFTFAGFYLRRAKRLLPAAYVTFAATAAAAPFFLASGELRDFGPQLGGSLSFTSNIVLWLQSGYFEGSATHKPLLHIWSLSIEEQYYFLLPALLGLVPRRWWLRVNLLLTAGSLALCLTLVHIYPAATFYLLPTRAWELGLGSLGALLTVDSLAESVLRVLFWPALILLLVLPGIQVAAYHPGPDALLICLATLVVVLRRHPLLFRGPGIRALAWTGDLSYSLYLLHWPLFAFLHNAWIGDFDNLSPPAGLRLGLLLASFLLAWLLHRFVEEPFRRAELKSGRRVLAWAAAATLCLLLLPRGINQAVATDADYTDARQVSRGFGADCDFSGRFRPLAQCRNAERPTTLLWGDSVAMHLVPGLLEEGDAAPELVQATRSACGPLLGMAHIDGHYNRHWAENCIAFNDSVAGYLKQADGIETVVLSSILEQYLSPESVILRKASPAGGIEQVDASLDQALSGLRKTVTTIRRLGKKAVLVASPPVASFDIGLCLERQDLGLPVLGNEHDCQINMAAWREEQEEVLQLLKAVSRELDVAIIRPSGFLCRSGVCRTAIGETFIYGDECHFSDQGSALVAERIGLNDRIARLAR